MSASTDPLLKTQVLWVYDEVANNSPSPVKHLLSPEERKLVELFALIIVDQTIKQANEKSV
jgi:hypothetical protein